MQRSLFIHSRPDEQGQQLNQLAQQLSGIHCLHMPVFSSRTINVDHSKAEKCQVHLFVSQAAVKGASVFLRQANLAQTQLIAIGPATAQCLIEQGIPRERIMVSPPPYNSESLLTLLPTLSQRQDIVRQHFAIWCAKAGRQHLKQVLSKRVKQVHELFCYQKQPIHMTDDSLQQAQQLIQQYPKVICLASSSSILNRQKQRLQTQLGQIDLYVISSRLRNLASQQAWRSIRTLNAFDNRTIIDFIRTV